MLRSPILRSTDGSQGTTPQGACAPRPPRQCGSRSERSQLPAPLRRPVSHGARRQPCLGRIFSPRRRHRQPSSPRSSRHPSIPARKRRKAELSRPERTGSVVGHRHPTPRRVRRPEGTRQRARVPRARLAREARGKTKRTRRRPRHRSRSQSRWWSLTWSRTWPHAPPPPPQTHPSRRRPLCLRPARRPQARDMPRWSRVARARDLFFYHAACGRVLRHLRTVSAAACADLRW